MIQTLTAGDDTPHFPPSPRPAQTGPASPSPQAETVSPQAETVRIRATTPTALLAVVPHLLGFVPQASLVVIGTGPPRDRIKVTLRYDLPDPPGAGVAADIAVHAAGVVGSQCLTAITAIGYGPESLVEPVASALRLEVEQAGLELKDILRVQDGRYWSYLCHDEACCPAAGTPFDPGPDSALAQAGPRVLPDRAAVAAQVAPLGGITAESMRRATRRAEQHVSRLLAKMRKSARVGAARQMIAAEGLNSVSSMIATYRSGGNFTKDYQIAWLTVALRDLRVRDDAWARMDPGYGEAHRRLWIDVTRRAQPGYVAGPAALLAFVAWQSGDGALANVALDRALADDPRYSMAMLLRQVISAGAPPSMARLPMTPEEVAASYEDAEDENLTDYDHETDSGIHDLDH